LGATYDDISEGEGVEVSSGDEDSRPPAKDAISDEEGLRDEENNLPLFRFETPPAWYEELFGPGPYPIFDTVITHSAVPGTNAAVLGSTGTPTT